MNIYKQKREREIKIAGYYSDKSVNTMKKEAFEKVNIETYITICKTSIKCREY